MRWKLRAFWRYRPRVLTLAVLVVTAALLVLANLSDDVHERRTMSRASGSSIILLDMNPAEWSFDVGEPEDFDSWAQAVWNLSYGWPLLWHQYITIRGYGFVVVGWRYSAGRLAGNVAMWLVMVVGATATCEWTLRRYRPRFRWSLRMMLAAVSLVAAFFGWFVWARDRANREDALIDAIKQRHGQVWLERWGPKWLDLIGADRYRRHIVAANVVVATLDLEEDQGQLEIESKVLQPLSQLNDLQYLILDAEDFTPGLAHALAGCRYLRALSIGSRETHPGAIGALADALRQMPRLRILNVAPGDALWNWENGQAYDEELNLKHREQVCHECLAAIGEATQVEQLRVFGVTLRAESLELLARLANLKRLTLHAIDRATVERGAPPLLSGLPTLPRLEALDLLQCDIGDDDLRFLARLSRLKSLYLSTKETEITAAGIKMLAPLSNLEELTLAAYAGTSVGMPVEVLEALPALARLKKLRIDIQYKQPAGPTGPSEMMPLIGHGPDDLRRGLGALELLRQTHPGIAIVPNIGRIHSDVLLSVLAEDEYDTADRQQTMATRECIKQWIKAGCPTYPPATPGSGGMF